MRFTLRELVLIGIFGALWAVVETTLGSVLHMAHVPFKGVILGSIGLVVLVIGRLYIPKQGATVAMGSVTAVLKLFSLGQFLYNPMIAILMEALLAELVLTLAGQPSRKSFVIAGALAISWNFFHPFFTWGILAGQGLATLWTETVEEGAQTLGLSPDTAYLIVILLLLIHIAAGLLAGWLGWQAGQRILSRHFMSVQSDPSVLERNL